MQKMRQISLALIGEPSVGKTSIIRLLDNSADSRGTTCQIETGDILYTLWELPTSSYDIYAQYGFLMYLYALCAASAP